MWLRAGVSGVFFLAFGFMECVFFLFLCLGGVFYGFDVDRTVDVSGLV